MLLKSDSQSVVLKVVGPSSNSSWQGETVQKKTKMQGWGFVYVFTFTFYHPYLVCVLFGVPYPYVFYISNVLFTCTY